MRKILWVCVCMLGWAGFFLTSSCQKDKFKPFKEKEKLERHTVRFKIREFPVEVLPLSGMPNAVQTLGGKPGNISPSTLNQILYYWSFNSENLVPDLGIDTLGAGVFFSSHSESGKISYPNGKAFLEYPPASALSINGGPNTLTFRLPLSQVSSLETLRFDLLSSNTGPKDFEIAYSFDTLAQFVILRETNQFTNTGNNAWNSFEYDLTQLKIIGDSPNLWIRLSFKSGERGSAGEYSQVTGTIRMDNLALTGIYNGQQPKNLDQDLGKIDYFVFNKADSLLVDRGSKPIAYLSSDEITLSLPLGEYFALFIYQDPEGDLSWSEPVQYARDFFAQADFSLYNKRYFGKKLDHIQVGGAQEMDIVLERFYSEVHVRFNDLDNTDLLSFVRIRAKNLRPYYPYKNTVPTLYEGDSPAIELTPSSFASYVAVQFNQFLGLQNQPVPLTYEMEVYDLTHQLIRSVELQASAKNNHRLIFTGPLEIVAPEPDFHRFLLLWNEEWDSTNPIPF